MAIITTSEQYNEIVKAKENIFQHILYEMQMYLQSYCIITNEVNLNQIQSISKENQDDTEKQKADIELRRVLFNFVWDSHFLHMRNLIEFFQNKNENNSERGSIGTRTVLKDEGEVVNLNIGSTDHYSTICEAVNHLSKKRYTENLTDEMDEAIKEMIPILSNKINNFIKLISDENNVNVKDEFGNHLKNNVIQQIINNIKEQLELIN